MQLYRLISQLEVGQESRWGEERAAEISEGYDKHQMCCPDILHTTILRSCYESVLREVIPYPNETQTWRLYFSVVRLWEDVRCLFPTNTLQSIMKHQKCYNHAPAFYFNTSELIHNVLKMYSFKKCSDKHTMHVRHASSTRVQTHKSHMWCVNVQMGFLWGPVE